MREKNIGFIFWVVIFGSFCYCSCNNEDSKSRQTFVIRYKDGEQTIPVTVVLDYKKQTEYVINMNPRTPAKSVTLYDFKQRTIAYKDLTNRECFLGRLTHETLIEEISALQDVKNPVEGKPKMRSLDPRKPALTPTEIRNIAGQKTAIFCRKMNTWLLMPERVHGISKREADHEYEERTYQYRGHRSSQYSHYEQETRRRYRNQSQANPRSRSQRHKSAAENGNGPEVSEPSLHPHHLNSQSSGSSYSNSNTSNSIPDIITQNYSSSSLVPQKTYFSTRRGVQNNKENVNNAISRTHGVPSSRSHSSTNNFSYPNYGSRPSSSSGSPAYSRPSFSASNYFNSNETDGTSLSDHGQIPDAAKGTSKHFEQNRHLAQLISDNTPTTTGSSTDVPFVPRGQEALYPNVHPSLIHLLPLYKPLSQEFDFGTPNSLETGAPSQVNNQNSHQRSIESELHPFPSAHLEPDNKFIHLTNEHNSSQNPEVSIDVLEIPRITKEFENVKVNASYVPAPQQENVRENHNSAENYPSVSQTYFKSTPYFQRSNPHSANATRSEHGSLPPDTSLNSVVRRTFFNESSFHIPQSYVSTTTVLPVLTTPEYSVTDRTTSNTVYVPSVHTAFQNSEDFNSFQIFPSYIENNNPLSLERNLTAPSVHLRNSKFSDESSESVTHNSFLTTGYPLIQRKHKTSSNHRSDIPSEEGNDRLPNHRVDIVRNAYPSLINSTANEGVPPYRIRYQNALRDFKPDEIVIDIENIPTHTLPPVTYSFQQKILTTIQPTVRSRSSGLIRSDTGRRSEQISGTTTLRSFYTTTRYPRRRINDKPRRLIQNGSISHAPKTSLNQNYHHAIKNQPQINQLIGVNHYSPAHHTNRRQFHYPSRPHPPSQVRMPTEVNQLHHFSQLNNLPPGVSVHPRHPQAPFAEMVHSNRPPTMPLVDDSQSPLKPHRQRHHRKKDRQLNSCCRLRGKSGAFQSCCRNGGPCCSRSRRRMQPPGSPCCAPSKAIGQIIPANQIPPPARITDPIVPPIRTEQVHRSDTGNKDRCQKEKMCRTLYESTQQVMVCRNAHIEGC